MRFRGYVQKGEKEVVKGGSKKNGVEIYIKKKKLMGREGRGGGG